MSEKKLTINVTKLEDSGCIAYEAIIVELNNSIVLAETLEDLFDAIPGTIEAFDEFIKKPVRV
jgi:hypothetical protein